MSGEPAAPASELRLHGSISVRLHRATSGNPLEPEVVGITTGEISSWKDRHALAHVLRLVADLIDPEVTP